MQTRPRSDRVVAEFKRRRKRHVIALILSLLGLFALVAAKNGVFVPPGYLVAVVAGVVVGAAWFMLYNWRCPACRKMLGRSLNPNFCSRCGAPLR